MDPEQVAIDHPDVAPDPVDLVYDEVALGEFEGA
jgi:hypothetical protein